MPTWYQRSFFKNCTAILLILLIIFLIHSLFPLLSTIGNFIAELIYPFLFSLILYYLLRPLVRLLAKKMSIKLAITITFLLFAAIVAFLTIYIYPILITEFNALNIKETAATNKLPEMGEKILENYEIRNAITKVLIDLNAFIVKNTLSIFVWITNFFFALFITPFILFYLLKDDKEIYHGLCKIIPFPYLPEAKDFFKDVDSTLLHFINGRVVIGIISGTLSLFCFLFLGLNYSFLLALIAAIFYIIPSVGAFIAKIPPLFVGFSTSYSLGIEVFLFMSIITGIEGFIVTPHILGKHLYIHPITVIIALLVGTLLFGVLGLFIATPAYALLKVIIHHGLKFWQKKSPTTEKLKSSLNNQE